MSEFYSQPWDRPFLTPSIARVLMEKTPFHARRACPFYSPERPTATAAMNEGSIVDGLVLGAGPRVTVIHTERFSKNVVKEFRDNAEAAGKIAIKSADWARCKRAAGMAQAEFGFKDKVAFIALKNGAIKHRLCWESNGVWCSTEPDIHHGDLVLDLKRTKVIPTVESWQRHVAKMGMNLQVAAVLEATGAKRFGWLIVEADPPHCVVVHYADDAFIKVARQDWKFARDTWANCVASNHFPAYEGGMIGPMPWQLDDGDDLIFTEDAA